jgi:hypothetical protein
VAPVQETWVEAERRESRAADDHDALVIPECASARGSLFYITFMG